MDLEGLLAGFSSLLGTAGKAWSTLQQIQAEKNAQAQSQEVFNIQQQQHAQIANQTPAQISQAILALKQPLSDDLKKSIMHDIANAMAATGAFSAPGIIQEAIAEALSKQDVTLLEQAVNAYFSNRQQQIQTTPQFQGYAPNFTASFQGDPMKPLSDYLNAKKTAIPGTAETGSFIGTPGSTDYSSGGSSTGVTGP